MRIVFIGAVEFSRKALEHLLSLEAEVVGVCTRSKSGFNADHADLAPVCVAHDIPCLQVDDLGSHEMASWIRDRVPDVIFCFGWSALLAQEILDIAPRGAVGFHPAALPMNRGRHPLIWALVLGLEATASTFLFLNGIADGGDILSQRRVAIDADDDARTLYDTVTNVALAQISEFLPLLAAGTHTRLPQDHACASHWRKRSARDGQIDWRMSARSIHNLVRGLARPYPGAQFAASDGRCIKVWKTAPVDAAPAHLEPGRIFSRLEGRPVIKCGEGAICLLETDPRFEPKVGDCL